jgi:hypothetical protein
MDQHFYNGFIKRAQDYGLTVVEADRLVKVAYDWPHQGPHNYDSPEDLPHVPGRVLMIPITAAVLLGRYLASRRNKEEVTEKKENIKKTV